ncbi:MAG: hypothetical protein J6S23_01275 [Clostridia bacterium]|nr:hypothetical protein [Clostridia bacterium]
MRNTITRKIVETTINGYTIEMENGKPTVVNLEPVVVFGNVTSERQAKRALVDVYGKETPVFIGEIKSEEVQYEISVEKFIENATRIDPKASDETASEN